MLEHARARILIFKHARPCSVLEFLFPSMLEPARCSIFSCSMQHYLIGVPKFKSFITIFKNFIVITGHCNACILSAIRYIVVRFGQDSNWIGPARILIPCVILLLIPLVTLLMFFTLSWFKEPNYVVQVHFVTFKIHCAKCFHDLHIGFDVWFWYS